MMRRHKSTRTLAFAALLGQACLSAAAAQNPPPVNEKPSPAIEVLRRDFMHPDMNTLTFHDTAEIFDTLMVPRAGGVWALPHRDSKPDFRYEWKGKSLPATDIIEQNFTNALLIMKGGTIVYENYFNRTNPDTHFVSFSMAKSFTSLMIGLALKDGAIHGLDDRVTKYVPELKGSGYDGPTIRNLLEMRSGVAYDERYDFDKHSVAQRVFEEAIVENTARFADFAALLKNGNPPGSTFNYSTMDTAVLGRVLERATGQPIEHYLAAKIWEKLGMESYGFFMADGPPGIGHALNGMGYNAILRDYARIGQMVLDRGFGNGQQIVPKDWIDVSTHPKPGPDKDAPGYGYQWWMAEPDHAFSAIGLHGQFIYVDPGSHTVVVKLSFFPDENPENYGQALAFCKAAASWVPK